jgi:hypothetical protein
MVGRDEIARTPREEEQLVTAERAGEPFVYFRDGAGRQQVQSLPETGGPLTAGRHSNLTSLPKLPPPMAPQVVY